MDREIEDGTADDVEAVIESEADEGISQEANSSGILVIMFVSDVFLIRYYKKFRSNRFSLFTYKYQIISPMIQICFFCHYQSVSFLKESFARFIASISCSCFI